ncbi:basic secretory family protein [Mucilaginibacter sp. RS28]|uniref:Basic secretory family protein n=1 Tax=Mucilaginibacter straminoryzae TaxID=2932774 RepID=A0A9X2BCH8_9SPHI|nr:basic secretory family protein [Mucilaginibacter straminoryzae]MCJ8209313.1 basic secretory family protein [Mucilaginibacter straminoryzae]
MKKLHLSMREHTYTSDVWQQQTGKSLDELWAEYAANPVL